MPKRQQRKWMLFGTAESGDHDDDKFVYCAFAANAMFIVSDDSHFDVLKEIAFPQLLVLKLKEFLAIL
jgi:predicted nucleic acid-binding protein